MVLEDALLANPRLLVSEEAKFRIKLSNGSAVSAGMAHDVYEFTALPMRHLCPKRTIVFLHGFPVPEGTIGASEKDDTILVRGSSADRQNILCMVQSLNVYLITKHNLGIALLYIATDTRIAADLVVRVCNDLKASSRSKVVIQRTNANLVQTHDCSKLKCGRRRIRQLDRNCGAAGGHITAYQMQYAKASDLSQFQLATFGAGGGGTIEAVTAAPWPSAVRRRLPCPPAGAAGVSAMAAQTGGDTRLTHTNLAKLPIDQKLSVVVSNHLSANSTIPTLRQRSISTRVAVYDGRTVAIGGLIAIQDPKGRNQAFGFPTNHAKRKKSPIKLLVYIPPHVVRNQQASPAITQQLRAHMPQMSEQ